MKKLLVLKGLPASGKSTHAKELVAKGWKRVNKDDLRAMIDDKKWSRENEKSILESEVQLAIGFLQDGFNVVVDDTNFAHEAMWKECAKKVGVEFEVKFFDVPLMECIERDSKRGEKSVGSKVIYSMYEKYLMPKRPVFNVDIPDCYIFDIDGTLAKTDGRSPYDYSKVITDKPNTDIVNLFKILANGSGGDDTLIIVSGRDSVCMPDTIKWLEMHGIVPDALYMRGQGDTRNDAIIKKEIYETHIKGKYNVLGVFDDRNRVVDLWRSLGLTCLQVAYGYF